MQTTSSFRSVFCGTSSPHNSPAQLWHHRSTHNVTSTGSRRGSRLCIRRRGPLHTRSAGMAVAASGDEPTAASAPAASTVDEQVGVVEELDVGNSMLYGWREGLVGWVKQAYPLWIITLAVWLPIWFYNTRL